MKRAFVVALVVALSAGLAGCTRTSELVAPQVDAQPDAHDASQTMTCGAPVHLGGTIATACAGAIAAQAGRFALCSCNDVVVPGSLIVNRVGAQSRPNCKSPPPGGSSMGPWGPCDGPMDGPNWPRTPTFFGAVGIDNGTLQAGVHADVPGALIIAGPGDVRVGAQGHVLGNVHVAGNLRLTNPYWITGDAFVGGDVAGPVNVSRTLHTPAASTVSLTVQPPPIVREPVTVAPPCNCDAGPAFDVAAAVDARRTTNNNSVLSLSATSLGDVQTAQTLDMPCGEYYLDTIKTGSGGMLTLRVHGHVGIFVAGDVSLENSVIVALDDGATLDLVVAKTFVVTAGSVFGAPTNPAGTRLWVGGNAIALPSTPFQFLAFVYAPGAFFSAGPLLDFSGSLFVGTLSVAKDARIGYDPAIMQAGGECGVRAPDPPQ